MAKQRKKDDQQEDLERALQPEHREDLLGQIEENTNLTGSTTWETLGEENEAGASSTESEADRERRRDPAHREDEVRDERSRQASSPNPPRTTKGGMTAPKFGSAGSGGAELEPGPERD